MRFLPIYISLLLLTACYQAESTLVDSLLYCTDKAPTSLNPQISHDIASLDATTHQLYNRLVKIDPISKRFIADIATHWETNKDLTRYTFFLRKNINFHHTDYFTPKRHLNADDIIFSFKRILSKKHPFHKVNNEKSNYLYNHPFSSSVNDIVKIDEHTVQFLLNKPDATLLANLAAHYAVIHSQEYALQLLQSGHPELIDHFPIGTGPYQFKENNNNHIIRYQSHKAPWKTPVTIENLIFDITPNSTKRYAKLLSGECDIITNPASSQIKQISKNARVSLSSQPTDNVTLIGFNTQNKPLDNAKIRHALSDAIDINTILDAVFFDSASVAKNLLASHSWAYNPRTESNIFNPIESVKALKINNFNFTRKLRILVPVKNSIFNPNFYKTAELIQSNWADIGIQSEIIILREIELQAALIAGEYDIYLTGNSPYIKDPDNLFRPLLSCNSTPLEGNSSHWCDPSLQLLLDATLLESNFIQRVKGYYKLQEIIHEQRIYLPIAHLLRFDVFNQNITGLLIDPLTGIDFKSVEKIAPLNKANTQ